MPVVESGSFELAVVNGEAHWLDYVQARAGRGAGARDVAGVLRYFRFNENYVQLHFLSSCFVRFDKTNFVLNPGALPAQNIKGTPEAF